jgi:hypothetical protein
VVSWRDIHEIAGNTNDLWHGGDKPEAAVPQFSINNEASA